MTTTERRGRAMNALRAAGLGAALLALAGAALPIPTRARTVTLLIDVSDSVGQEGIEASREAALSLIRSLDSRDRVAALAFAGKASVITGPIAPGPAELLMESAALRAPSPESTDLAAALRAATELAATGPGSGRVYLFSDGRSTRGRAVMESLAGGTSSPRRGIAIDTIPIGKAASGLVSRGLSVPELAHPGERLLLDWKVYSPAPGTISYDLRVDGSRVSRARVPVSAGLNEIPLSVEAGGTGRHEVLVQALGSEEARSGAYLEVGGEARILVVSGDRARSPIAAALETQGMRVDSGGPEALPEEEGGYSSREAVVLDDLPALSITEAQQSRLQDYVAGGGGLLVVGGESSLGRGEYYATPLEDMLPVSTDDRQRLLFTRSKLLFIIDHSGSMSEKVGRETKQMIAMRGVAASINELNPLDEVGVLGFDSSPTWVLPFTPASQRAKILASLSSLGEGGGTDLATALDEALRGFGEPGPTKRHAVVLTDGLTPDADFRGLASKLSAAGVSVSTIGIGDEINDTLLANIAKWCGGRFYRSSAEQIPTIIDRETMRMTRDLVQEGRITTRVVQASPVVEGLGESLPPVGGYLLTSLKPLATLLIEAESSSEGTSGEQSASSPVAKPSWDPLLATWRYGNGRVAVFASDSGRRWLSAWTGSAAYNRLWSQAVRSVERSSTEDSLRASASFEGGSAHIVVEAIGQDRRSVASLHLVGRATGSSTSNPGASTLNGPLPNSLSAQGFSLEETAPGRYEGYASPSGPGLTSFEVLDPVTGARASTWAWSPPGPESTRLGPDETTLSLIASATGGKLLSANRLEPPARELRWQRSGLGLPLLVLAALLLVVELYLRSTMTGQVSRARAALASWWATQKGIAEASRLRRWPPVESSRSEDGDRRYAEMQRRIAEHVARRYEEGSVKGEKDV